MRIPALEAIDFYKADHRRQYPEGTTLVYSNLTPRSNKLSNLPSHNEEMVFFGLQYFIKDFLIENFNDTFFKLPKDQVVADYKSRMDTSLGPDSIPVEHIEALHDLGYLPIEIRALKEGSVVSMKVPVLTIHNTDPRFFWLVNYLESVMSCYLWKPSVSATTARWYKRCLLTSAKVTGAPEAFVPFQAHDFSFRGMSGVSDAAASGAAHLTSFVGTDTVPAIKFHELFYGADRNKELIGCSVPATEHSVMCAGSKESEEETFKRLLNLYPVGIVSIVSDTWDFWKVVTQIASDLKPVIMARTAIKDADGNILVPGKTVFRPDSGDPVNIICGDPTAPVGSPAHKGAVQCLWDIFGGTVNAKGYKELDSHVGVIYGDSITPHRAKAIMEGLLLNGFASNNIVFGVGSFTYQYATRDTMGIAMKATYVEVNGVGREIFKDPVTDNGTKKSAKGLLAVRNGVLYDQQTWKETLDSDLELVFHNGLLMRDQTLAEIRAIVAKTLADEFTKAKAA